jgi:uncharacterized protein (UPF0548 family)
VSALTYTEVGRTEGGDLPAGYRHLRYRTPLPPAAYRRAGAAVLGWRMHRAAGMRVTASADRAAPGVRVTSTLGVGPVRMVAPCEVVWTVDDDERIGFGYGTLPGHPARGEESFVVQRRPDGGVDLVITSFSRPADWRMRLGGPVGPLFQRVWAAWLGRTLRRIAGDAGR